MTVFLLKETSELLCVDKNTFIREGVFFAPLRNFYKERMVVGEMEDPSSSFTINYLTKNRRQTWLRAHCHLSYVQTKVAMNYILRR